MGTASVYSVSTHSVADISVLTDNMKSIKKTLTNQKVTIAIAKLTARLEESDHKQACSLLKVLTPPASTNSTNPAVAHQRVKKHKTKTTTLC